ncbi:cobaltochelatase subunit CobT [Ponticaulis sp.]|uniref:cobaltochelatase subunit CobT n=1 Tax=Ponticaulis sp. TaxID=2020902 RepID=UPI000B6FB32B|nr:cobaltochelatase subunit CobT [Ponticaulis sp.]MAI90972.1 cobaltochelatase subunit CobT [Ponticaulis sp.]OUX98313.1 MAG: cobaltochelatase subunit CobT [Hyphomonadaceae bacterium TMED5]|tara:strand:- start:166672 stop:168627 length:1956 start_codon:yes stop_codon:yes gene_type:complete
MAKKETQADELFKEALGITTKAMSATDEVEVSFSPDGTAQQGKKIVLRTPPKTIDPAVAARIRGEADAAALHLAHHDAAKHLRNAPKSPEARAVFEAAERARVESIGAAHMAGVAANLDATLVDRCEKQGLSKLSSREMAPLSDAVEFILREKLTGRDLPPVAKFIADLYRQDIENALGDRLTGLTENMDDQNAFARIVKDLIRDLTEGEIQDGEEMEDAEEESTEDDDAKAQQGEEDTEDSSETMGSSMEEIDSSDMDSDQEEDSNVTMEADVDMEAGEEPEDVEDGSQPMRPNFQSSDARNELRYKVFTNAHDEVVQADTLCDPEELTRLRSYLDQQLSGLQGAVSRLANKLQRRLMAQQNRSWTFDLEEGVLDTARLTRVITDPTSPLSFKQEDDSNFRDTVVTLLMDNSGSMRGRPIMVAALCADILARTLERCGVKTEILGFTTRAWKGGLSREDWVQSGKPAAPGRLNDLRHIVYKPADNPWRRSRRNLGLMMREGLLKENIDGEALIWAHERLLARPEQRRILMVISDGAPVDDSTLSVNVGNYLERHLREVIDYIENKSDVELIAIGIGHDVTRYYKRAVTIVDAEQLGGAMTEQLASLFDEDGKPGASDKVSKKSRDDGLGVASISVTKRADVKELSRALKT